VLQYGKAIGSLRTWLVGAASMLAAAFAPAVPAAQASTCTLQAIPVSAPALPPELVKMAASYFHPGKRSYFQVPIEGAGRFAYYDPAQPFLRVVPPDSLYSAQFNTENYIVGSGFPPSYSTVVVNTTSGDANVLQGDTLRVHDVVETPDKSLWILGLQGWPPADGSLVLKTVGRGQPASRLGMTGKGKLAAIWVDRGSASDGKIALRMAWIDDRGNAQPAIDVDLVKLPPSYADLSVDTGTNLVVAPYGDKLVIAWRTLLAPSGVPADTSQPSKFSAAVRMIVVAPGKKPRLIAQHPTTLEPVDFVNDRLRRWPLDPGDALSISLNGEPVFLWLEATGLNLRFELQQSLVAARVNDAEPATLVADSFHTLWAPASNSGGQSVVMNVYSASSPEFRRFEIGCKDEKTSPRN
jgi:hypothetical protein